MLSKLAQSFNTPRVTVKDVFEHYYPRFYRFQYTSCYGQSTAEIILVQVSLCFNTPRVTVKGFPATKMFVESACFNTHRVTVKGMIKWRTCKAISGFNTPRVTVKAKRLHTYKCLYRVSIHLVLRSKIGQVRHLLALMKFQYTSCYGQRVSCSFISRSLPSFNTPRVTVKGSSMAPYSINLSKFQYTSCYGC